jgi:glyceraldehyde-3-phosphate dehydrogenase/erythrose-4-phosphate dehydrogenase
MTVPKGTGKLTGFARGLDRLHGHRQSPYSSILDSGLTAVLERSLVTVVSYGKEWGYSNRCVELAQRALVHAHA